MSEKTPSTARALLRPFLQLFFPPVPKGMKRRGSGSRIRFPRRVTAPSAMEIGDNTVVMPNAVLTAITSDKGRRFSPKLVIGSRVYIGHHSYLVCCNELIIEDGCVISDHVYINDAYHGMDPSAGHIMDQPVYSPGPIRIGKSCFIGYRAVLLPGVNLGDHCIVGANSVVTGSFPSYSTIAPAPARLVDSCAPGG